MTAKLGVVCLAQVSVWGMPAPLNGTAHNIYLLVIICYLGVLEITIYREYGVVSGDSMGVRLWRHFMEVGVWRLV